MSTVNASTPQHLLYVVGVHSIEDRHQAFRRPKRGVLWPGVVQHIFTLLHSSKVKQLVTSKNLKSYKCFQYKLIG